MSNNFYLGHTGGNISLRAYADSTTGVYVTEGANAPNRKLVFYEGSLHNAHEYIGFGTAAGVLKYQVHTTGANHVFYAATSSSASNTLFTVLGTGGFTSNGNSSVTGTFGVSGAVTLTTALPVASGGTGVTASTGTAAVVLSTSPTLVTPILGVATATSITLPATLTSAKISMYGAAPNAFQFDGLGTAVNTFKYQLAATTNSHVFYAGLSSTTEQELFRILGTGGCVITTNLSGTTYPLEILNSNTTVGNVEAYTFGQARGSANAAQISYLYQGSNNTSSAAYFGLSGASKPNLRFQNNGVATFQDCGVVVDTLVTNTVNMTTYTMSGDDGWANVNDEICGNWGVYETAGEALDLGSGDIWHNYLGRTIWVTIIWTGCRASNALGSNYIWIEHNAAVRYGSQNNSGIDFWTTCASFKMLNNDNLRFYGYQDSGSGNNFKAANARIHVTIH